jgi:hypothetical protein
LGGGAGGGGGGGGWGGGGGPGGEMNQALYAHMKNEKKKIRLRWPSAGIHLELRLRFLSL